MASVVKGLRGQRRWDGLTGYCCATCRYFAPKPTELTPAIGRCRRNAPTRTGYPVVFGDTDWCGEHKIGINPSKHELLAE